MSSVGSQDSWLQGLLKRRWLVLVLSSLAFLLITAIDAVVSSDGRALALGWGGWLRLGTCLILFFWFAVFVFTSEERGWFRGRRRVVHAVVFGTWLCCSAVLLYVPTQTLPVVFLLGLPIGYVAQWWLQGI